MAEQDDILNVSTGQIVTGGTIVDGNTQVVLAGGKVYDNLISGGNQIVSSGGFVSKVTLDGGYWTVNGIRQGSQTILSGGSAYDTQILEGYQTVSDGAITSGTSIYFFGSQTILSGGREENVTVYYNGFQYVSSGGIIDNATISSGGWQSVYSGGIVSNSIINNEGRLIIDNGGYINNLVVNGGAIDVNGNVSNIIINSGGRVGFGLDGKVEGEVTLNPGGSALITTSNGGVINLVGDNNGGLCINGEPPLINWDGNNASVTTQITGFSGTDSDHSDSIQLQYADIEFGNLANVTFPDNDHITITMDTGFSLTLNIIGIKQIGYSITSRDDESGLFLTVCFLAATEIRTKAGNKNIENLQVGDFVITYDWIKKKYIERKVTWVGQKRCRVKTYLPDDMAGYPVRILKGAIATNVPYKDLLITPEHCLFFKDKFIPVRMLVNGSTILYDYSITSYEYYHIEVENHAVIIADGVRTESYLDTGNRHLFNHHRKVIETSLQKPKYWDADSAAPLNVTRDVVEPIYNRLKRRAFKIKSDYQNNTYSLVADSDIHLMTNDGKIIGQKRVSDDYVTFMVPALAQSVWIMSRYNRPCDVIGPFVDDRRYLGVLVGKIKIYANDQLNFMTIHHEKEKLEGWNTKENAECRWTKGKAFLPLDGKAAIDDLVIYISFQILAGGPYIDVTKEDDNTNMILVS